MTILTPDPAPPPIQGPGLPPTSNSPRWSPITKMVIGLTLVAIAAGILIYFRSIIGPLILAFVLAYLLHPAIQFFSRATRISWRWSVNLSYILLVVILLSLAGLMGVVIVQQLQSLVGFVQQFVTDLPGIVSNLASQEYSIGPFVLRPGLLGDLNQLTNQLLGVVEPLIGRVGGIITSIASGAAGTLGWILFVLVISYFLLAEGERVPNELVRVELPGYNEDLRRLSQELRKIWNAFLRGQWIVIGLVIVSYFFLMTILGIRFALGIAIIAGLGRFVPYLGPLVNWIVIVMVALFQGNNYFGLQPWQYALLVLVAGFILDQIFDNLVSPRFLGNAVGVHPAAVLIGALILARLIGLIGLVLAAPVVATLKLMGDYVLRKMFDLDPFTEEPVERRPAEQWTRTARRAQAWWRAVRRH